MGKRLRNYRTGDRAEDLGIFLLRAFCAVAPIPRQEDFGLADAVATLLRKEERFWLAEDSFLVQFKSRTVKRLDLQGALFQRWLNQDLSVFVARVNLIESAIEVFTLGTVLSSRKLHEASGLVAWLEGGEEALQEPDLHILLQKPILRWTVADTEDPQFSHRTYGILKEWLRLERWNRRYFRAGVAREITWETNATPEGGDVLHSWTPVRGREALADIEPLIHLLGLHARQHPELWARMHAVEAALRGPDDQSILAGIRPVLQMSDALSRLAEVAKAHPTADAVLTLQFLRCDQEGADFWLFTHSREGTGSATRHRGTWDELKVKGFDHEIEGSKVTLSLDRYFATRPTPHEAMDGPTDTPTLERGDHSPFYFLRRLPGTGLAPADGG